MGKKYNICLDIGGTKVLGAVFNSKDKMLCKIKKRSTEKGNSSENIEQVIISVTKELIEKANIKLSQVNAISAGVPGIINSDTGVVLFTPNLPWKNYDLKSAIEKEFGTKFYLGNDVNVGVLGEYKYGAARGYKHVVGFFIGTAVGSLARFLVHYVVGATVWAEYMPDSFFGMTMTTPWFYSFLYNGSYMLIDMLLCLVVGALLFKPLGTYIRGEDLKK